MLGWVPSNNPFERQWQVVPLRAAAVEEDEAADSASASVQVRAYSTNKTSVNLSHAWFPGCQRQRRRRHRQRPLALRARATRDSARLASVWHTIQPGGHLLPERERPSWSRSLHRRELSVVLEDVGAASQPIFRLDHGGWEVRVPGPTGLLGLIDTGVE